MHKDYDSGNFKWIDCDSEADCVYAFLRKGKDADILAVFNFSDWEKADYIVKIGENTGVELIIDTEWEKFGGNSSQSSYFTENDEITIDIQPYSGKVYKIMRDL